MSDLVELEVLLDRYGLILKDRLAVQTQVEDRLQACLDECLRLIYAPLAGQRNDEELRRTVASVTEEVCVAATRLGRALVEGGVRLKRLGDERRAAND